MSLAVAAHQPGYHRHLYYFAKLAAADVFVSLDAVQYAAAEWQNRQQFWVDGRRRWLSVPVDRGRAPLAEKRLVDPDAPAAHWATLQRCWARTPYFADVRADLAAIYRHPWRRLVELCDALTGLARDVLRISTPVVAASELAVDPGLARGELLAALSRAAAGPGGAADEVTYLACATPIRPDHYLLRPGADGRTERAVIEAAGVAVGTFDYRPPRYRQHQLPVDAPFEPELSVFDLIVNCGPGAAGVLSAAVRREGVPR